MEVEEEERLNRGKNRGRTWHEEKATREEEQDEEKEWRMGEMEDKGQKREGRGEEEQ